MAINFVLSDEICIWKDEIAEAGILGNKAIGKNGIPYDKVDQTKRIDALLILINRLKNLGAEREYFVGTRRDEIISSINPPKKSIPLSSWRERIRGTSKDLDKVLNRVFGPRRPENVVVNSNSIDEKIRQEGIAEFGEDVQEAESSLPIKKSERKEFDPSTIGGGFGKVDEQEINPEMAELLGYKK